MAITRYLVQHAEESITFYQDVLGFTLRQHFGPPFGSPGRPPRRASRCRMGTSPSPAVGTASS